MTLPPWEYLFLPFNDVNFPDLFNAIWVFSLIGMLATVLLYNVRTRQLRRHQVYLDLYEWLLWAGVIFFFMLLIYALFHFDFLFVVLSIPIGRRDPSLDPLRALPAVPRGVRDAARPGPLLLEAEVRPPRGDDPPEARGALPDGPLAAPPPLRPAAAGGTAEASDRWRSGASGSATGALTARPGRRASPAR